MQNLSCENEFYLHEHKKSFSSVAWHLVSPWNRGLGQIGNCVLAIETKALAAKRKTRSENMTALHCFVTDACSRPETRNYLVFVDFSVRCCGLISQNVTNLPNWGWWAIAKSVFFFGGGGGISNTAALFRTVKNRWRILHSVQTFSIANSPYSGHIRSVHLIITSGHSQ